MKTNTPTIRAREKVETPGNGSDYLGEYLSLCAAFPLAPILTKAKLRKAEKVMDGLAIIDEERITAARSDYLAVLTDLYEAAERRLFVGELADLQRSLDAITAIDSLKFLLGQHGMSGGDLGRLLGNRQLGSAILRGDRQLSKAHIRTLADHFAVSADLFL